jgi:hypothetical protein
MSMAHTIVDEAHSQLHIMPEVQQFRHTQLSEQPSPNRGQKIPWHEQDEDRWRFERPIPGRDPVTEERGMGA